METARGHGGVVGVSDQKAELRVFEARARDARAEFTAWCEKNWGGSSGLAQRCAELYAETKDPRVKARLMEFQAKIAGMTEPLAKPEVNIDARQQTVSLDRGAMDALLESPETREAAMRLLEARAGVNPERRNGDS